MSRRSPWHSEAEFGRHAEKTANQSTLRLTPSWQIDELDAGGEAPASLLFPAAAAAFANSRRGALKAAARKRLIAAQVQSNEDSWVGELAAPTPHLSFVQELESQFERTQARLDQLKGDVEAFRLPPKPRGQEPDHRPFAA